ncbi:MAG: cytochrome b/b6 domain-containing protein [Bdellovibrio sp.]
MQKYSFKKYQPLSLRIWHWTNAITLSGILATVMLRKTFLSWRSNVSIIQDKLQEAGIQITPELAKKVAVGIRTPMWDWHFTLGFVLAGSLVVRILIFIFVEKKCPVTQACKSIFNINKIPPSERKTALHHVFVKSGYAVFYVVTSLMVASGLSMYFSSNLGLAKDLVENIKEVHEVTMWFFVVFILGHLAGIVMAENQNDSGIVSDMINGGKNLK